MHYLIYIAAWLFFLVGCKENQSNQTSDIKLELEKLGQGVEKIDIYNIEHDVFGTFTLEDSIQTLNIPEDMVLSIVKDRQASYVHLQEGESIELTKVDGDDAVIGIDPSKSSPENKYLAQYLEISNNQSDTYRLPELTKMQPDSFKLSLDAKYQAIEDLVQTIQADQNVTQNFKNQMKLRAEGSKASDLLEYKAFYNHWYKKYPELPDDFYSDVEKIDFRNPALLSFQGGEHLLNAWTSKDLDYSDFDNAGSYFDKLSEVSSEILGNSVPGQFRAYDLISNQINFGDGLVAAEDMIKNFRASVNHKWLNHKLDQTIEPWLHLKTGLEAPDFVAMNRSGKEIKLSELKGKRVYIDVWATWCGPCIAEIPALKELESELHDENIEFVSVSIDKAKDKEKWAKFVEEKELKGVQLMAYNDWNSDVTKQYNIKGIPRFILIDELGKIMSANAPRPSDPKTKGLLSKNL